MKTIWIESDIGEFESEFLHITEEQFNELVDASALSRGGYWLLGEQEWLILCIGLDMIPGREQIEVELQSTH